MAVEVVYLAITPDREVRALKRPRWRDDEVYVRIRLNYPDTWGKIVGTFDVDVANLPTIEGVEPIQPDTGS